MVFTNDFIKLALEQLDPKTTRKVSWKGIKNNEFTKQMSNQTKHEFHEAWGKNSNVAQYF